jgi:hypothetical protein
MKFRCPLYDSNAATTPVIEAALSFCVRPPTSAELRLTMDIQRFLIGLGLVILLAGIIWPIVSRIGLGRLPGDIVFQRGGSRSPINQNIR